MHQHASCAERGRLVARRDLIDRSHRSDPAASAGEGFVEPNSHRGFETHQHERASQAGRALFIRFGCLAEWQLEPERAALAFDALHAHASVHQFDQLFGDGRTQSGAAELATDARLGLREALEHARERLSAHSDTGVAHGKAQHDAVIVAIEHRDFDGDRSLLGELERVAEQVHEHLPQMVRIAQQRVRHLGHDGDVHPQPFHLRLGPEDAHRRVDEGVQIERDALDLQLARLDLGEVEHVVDQLQQHLRCARQRVEQVALIALELGLRQQLRHVHHGVQRGAHLVTDVGHEATLGRVRRFRPRDRDEVLPYQAEYIPAKRRADQCDRQADRQMALPPGHECDHRTKAQQTQPCR